MSAHGDTWKMMYFILPLIGFNIKITRNFFIKLKINKILIEPVEIGWKRILQEEWRDRKGRTKSREKLKRLGELKR
jgi:hypothetical protein